MSDGNMWGIKIRFKYWQIYFLVMFINFDNGEKIYFNSVFKCQIGQIGGIGGHSISIGGIV